MAVQGILPNDSFHQEDLYGTWKGENHEGIVRFKHDGTFEVVHPFEDEDTLISKGGNWILDKSTKNKTRLDIVTEGYSANWELSGSRGMFEQTKSWRIYNWEGDPDDGIGDSFIKTNRQ